MSKQKIVILVLLVVGLISIFLPWGKIYGMGELDSDVFYQEEIDPGNMRVVVIILYLIPLIISLLNKSKYLARLPLFGSIIPPFLFSVLIVYGIIETGASFTIERYIVDDADRLQIGPAICILHFVGILIPVFGLALKKSTRL